MKLIKSTIHNTYLNLSIAKDISHSYVKGEGYTLVTFTGGFGSTKEYYIDKPIEEIIEFIKSDETILEAFFQTR